MVGFDFGPIILMMFDCWEGKGARLKSGLEDEGETGVGGGEV